MITALAVKSGGNLTRNDGGVGWEGGGDDGGGGG